MRKHPLIEPRWLSYEVAAAYSSFCTRHIEKLVAAKLVKSKNVKLPGANRGRRVIDRLSLDAFIEGFDDEASPLVMNSKSEKP